MGCTEVLALVDTALSKGKAAIDKADQKTVDTNKTAAAEAALEAISSRNTLQADIATCSSDQKSQLQSKANELSAWKTDIVDKVVTALGGNPGTTASGGTSAGGTSEGTTSAGGTSGGTSSAGGTSGATSSSGGTVSAGGTSGGTTSSGDTSGGTTSAGETSNETTSVTPTKASTSKTTTKDTS